jgi:hypothetical protein
VVSKIAMRRETGDESVIRAMSCHEQEKQPDYEPSERRPLVGPRSTNHALVGAVRSRFWLPMSSGPWPVSTRYQFASRRKQGRFATGF